MRRAALAPASLSEPAGDDGPALGELLATAAPATVAGVGERDEAACVRTAVTALDERARRVVELRYGIDGEDARTLTEVAGELGVSPQRVRKLEAVRCARSRRGRSCG